MENMNEKHESQVNKVILSISSRVKKLFDKPLIIIAIITLIGVVLRLYHLGFKPFWYDEAVLYWISKSGNLNHIIAQNALRNSAPPLFAILLSLFMKIGDSESRLRLLPFLGGVASIPAIYFLSRQFFGRVPAYISSLLIAIAPTQIQYSQQLREYSLTFFIATIILIFFCMLLQHPTKKNLALMTAAMVIGIFLQYGLALLIIALNLVFFIALWSVKAGRKSILLRWFVSQLIVFCAVIAVYFLSLKQQMQVGFGASYLSKGYWTGGLKALLNLADSNTSAIFTFAFPGIVFLTLTVLGLILSLQAKKRYLTFMLFFFPLLLTFIAALAKLYPYLGLRQDIFLTPLMYVFFGFGLVDLGSFIHQRWIGGISLLVLLLFVILVGFQASRTYLLDQGIGNMRPIVETLSKSFERGDKIYVYYFAEPGFTYYYKDNKDSWINGADHNGYQNGYFQEIDNIIASNDRVWMVFSLCPGDDCQKIPQHVAKERKIDLVAKSPGDSYLYLVH
jgi:uncharacterized membrane protein